MDEARSQTRAYEYLCHLEEARRWLEAAAGTQLPPAAQLGERLANGVVLCKVRQGEVPRKWRNAAQHDTHTPVSTHAAARGGRAGQDESQADF